MTYKRFSKKITIFQGRKTPEESTLVGYGAIIDELGLQIPYPDRLTLISDRTRKYENSNWQVFPSSYLPKDRLYNHLIFAIKYESINLLFFKRLFQNISQADIEQLIKEEPFGQYSRKIWFLYEWLMNNELGIPDLDKGNYVQLINEDQQFAIKGVRSRRHRIINNLPGNRNFCPLVFKSRKLLDYLNVDWKKKQDNQLRNYRKEILQRASAFLLLKDSRASFAIEGESPKSKRATRWGNAIGQAGKYPLSKEELLRLQQIVIENPRFVKLGFRQQGGFVGEHDRTTGEPIPEHISARWKDLDKLINGLLETDQLFENSNIDAIIAASVVAFGFIFIHPFQDGNGRIHRYLIHHVLARKNFTPQGLVFPVSASILNHMDDYRKVLEKFAKPILEFIDWETTSDNTIKVINETIDFYSYFDATHQVEFLYDCIYDTIQNIIPQEVSYLAKFDQFKRYLDEEYEMPDKTIALLVRFLEQKHGILSQRARKKEFAALTDKEIIDIEERYRSIFTEYE